MRSVSRTAASVRGTEPSFLIEDRVPCYLVARPSPRFHGLLSLPTLRDATQRRTAFRQGLATLARSASASGPSPLEGVPPDQILAAVRTALDNQFFEDLDWLSPAGVGVALYELGTALPSGPEQRDLGRRVLLRLHAGTAETFATIATRMVRSTRKGPFGAAFRARVSLVFSAPPWAVNAGPLAYAFVTRRARPEWIGARSTGPLPARRLAARMIERAAMVAARRALGRRVRRARVRHRGHRAALRAPARRPRTARVAPRGRRARPPRRRRHDPLQGHARRTPPTPHPDRVAPRGGVSRDRDCHRARQGPVSRARSPARADCAVRSRASSAPSRRSASRARSTSNPRPPRSCSTRWSTPTRAAPPRASRRSPAR